MKNLLMIPLFIAFMALLSCGSGQTKKDYSGEKQLTERIQYDIMIKSPDQDLDWWTQNIEGSKREAFVKTILELASSGKMIAYDYLNDSMTVDDVKAIESRSETITVADPDDPSITRDTVITEKLDIQTITKVRFLEEWYLDEKNLSFDKKVCGVMLLRENYDDSLEFRGYTPLFWLYFDKDYPAKMK
jgi:hypothetical protein